MDSDKGQLLSQTLQKQLDDVEEKRAQLASLVTLAKQYSGHTQSMRNAWLLARPSQNYPAKLRDTDKHSEYTSLKQVPLETLLGQSKEKDQVCITQFDGLLSSMDLSSGSPDENDPRIDLPDDLQHRFKLFSSATTSAVAHKITLQDQGVVTPPVKFSVPQEVIGEQIDELVQVNKDLGNRITQKLGELLSSVTSLLRSEGLSEKLTSKLSFVKHSLDKNKEHLEGKGAIEQLPCELEDLELDGISEDKIERFIKDQAAKEASAIEPESRSDKAAVEIVEPTESAGKGKGDTKKSFFQKLSAWLSSPMSTRWRDLD